MIDHRGAERDAAHRRRRRCHGRTASPSSTASCISPPKRTRRSRATIRRPTRSTGSSRPARRRRTWCCRQRTRARSSPRTSAATACRRFEQGAGGAWTQTVIPVGKGPEGIDLSPDGREVWSAHSRDGGVSIIDVASKKVVQTIALGTKRSNRIKLTPDGKFALVSDLDAGELVVARRRRRARRSSASPLGKMPEGILIAAGRRRRLRRGQRRQLHRRRRSRRPGR